MNRRSASEPAPPREDESPVIDTSGMSEGKRQALELTESSREGHWDYPTFAGALFMGQFPWKLIHPFPETAQDHDERGEKFLRDRFRGVRDNTDRAGYTLAQRVLENEMDWLYADVTRDPD